MKAVHTLHLVLAEVVPVAEVVVFPKPSTLRAVVVQNRVHHRARGSQQGILFQVGRSDLFVDTNFAVIGPVQTGNHSQQSGFAAAVPAQQS